MHHQGMFFCNAAVALPASNENDPNSDEFEVMNILYEDVKFNIEYISGRTKSGR